MYPSFLRSYLLMAALLASAVPAVSAESAEPVLPAQEGEQARTVFLPEGDLFKPLIADLSLPRFSVSYRRYHYNGEAINIAAVGVDQLFGLHRSVDPATRSGWQVSFEGGLQAQFNLDASSKDLTNSDYFVGFPVSYRSGRMSYRVKLYHKSSHLGDEYLVHNEPTRMEFSYEALRIVQSYEWRKWRQYGGFEVFLRKEPKTLKTLIVQGGVEYNASSPLWGRGIPVAGLDIKSTEAHDWAVDATVVAGLEFRGVPNRSRCIRVLLEGYKGHNPHGQFYTDDVRIGFYGIGVYFGY
jgi:hypothetical protein